MLKVMKLVFFGDKLKTFFDFYDSKSERKTRSLDGGRTLLEILLQLILRSFLLFVVTTSAHALVQ